MQQLANKQIYQYWQSIIIIPYWSEAEMCSPINQWQREFYKITKKIHFKIFWKRRNNE